MLKNLIPWIKKAILRQPPKTDEQRRKEAVDYLVKTYGRTGATGSYEQLSMRSCVARIAKIVGKENENQRVFGRTLGAACVD